MRKERFEAISDAVLAIVITLMVLEIKITDLNAENVHGFLFQLLIYAISFAFIVILWLNHHNMFKGVEMIDFKTIWINFWLLFSASLIPLATRVLNESFFDRKNHIFFGAIMTAAFFFYSLLEERAIKLSNNNHASFVRKMNWSATLLIFLSIPLSFISIYISAIIFVSLPLTYFLLPHKYVEEENSMLIED